MSMESSDRGATATNPAVARAVYEAYVARDRAAIKALLADAIQSLAYKASGMSRISHAMSRQRRVTYTWSLRS